MSEHDYGEKFEKPIIVAMSALIILSILSVVVLIKTYTPECKPSYETYCPENLQNDHH